MEIEELNVLIGNDGGVLSRGTEVLLITCNANLFLGFSLL